MVACKHANASALALFLLLLVRASNAQTAPPDQKPTDQPPAPAATGPTVLPTPAITSPLQELPPAMFDAGPFGKIAVNGV
jgi:hypothetical protein